MKKFFLCISFLFCTFFLCCLLPCCSDLSDVWQEPVRDYLEEYASRAMITRAIVPQDSLYSIDGIVNAPGYDDFSLTLELKNDRGFSFQKDQGISISLDSFDRASALEVFREQAEVLDDAISKISFAQTSPMTIIVTFPRLLLSLADTGFDISPTFTLWHPTTRVEFQKTIPIRMKANSPPPNIDAAIYKGETGFSLCFSVLEQNQINIINSDITGILIDGTKYSVGVKTIDEKRQLVIEDESPFQKGEPPSSFKKIIGEVGQGDEFYISVDPNLEQHSICYIDRAGLKGKETVLVIPQDQMISPEVRDVLYTVEHYLQNENILGYEKASSVSLYAKAGTAPIYALMAKEGFEQNTQMSQVPSMVNQDGSTVVKLYYDRKTVTLTFMIDDITDPQNPVYSTMTGKYGTLVSFEQEPAIEGYDFVSWTPSIPKTYPSSDATYTATYILKGNFAISFELNGGTNDSSNTSQGKDILEYNAQSNFPIVLQDATKQGYVFAGWWTSSSFKAGTQIASIDSVAIGSKKLYAKWQAATDVAYRVEHYLQNNFDKNNATYSSSAYNTENLVGSTGEIATFTPQNITGYEYDATKTQNIKIKADGSSIAKLYYNRKEITLTLNFDDGGDVADDTIVGLFQDSVSPPSPPSRTGYTFTQWSPALPQTFPDSDQAYTALWALSSDWPITYELLPQGEIDSSAKNDANNPTGYNINTSFSFLPASRTGYSFSGWYTSATTQDDTTKITQITANGSMTGALTLYAKWQAAQSDYKIEHFFEDVQGNYAEDATKSQTVASTTGSVISFQDFAKATQAGFECVEAKTKIDGTCCVQSTVKAGNATIVELYYERKTVTVTLDLDGGTGLQDLTYQGKYGTAFLIDITGVQKQDYELQGWKKNAQSSVASLPLVFPPQDETYTALWSQAQSYTITYNLLPQGEQDSDVQNDADNPQKYNKTTKDIILKNATRSGFVFAGWYEDATYMTPVAKIPHGSTGDITLYAKWKEIKEYYVSSPTGSDTTGDGTKTNPFATLSKAVQTVIDVNDATSNYTIYVSGQVQSVATSVIRTTKTLNLLIQKQTGAQQAQIAGQHRLILIDALNAKIQVKDIDLLNGCSNDGNEGGNILIENGELTYTNGKITGATGNAGVCIKGGTATFNGTNISDNVGGAIKAQGGNVSLLSCVIQNNSQKAAIDVGSSATLVATNCKIQANSGGGGIYMDGNVTLDSCVIQGNTGKTLQDSVGIYVENAAGGGVGNGVLKVKGNMQIGSSSDSNNIYLTTGKYITVMDTLSSSYMNVKIDDVDATFSQKDSVLEATSAMIDSSLCSKFHLQNCTGYELSPGGTSGTSTKGLLKQIVIQEGGKIIVLLPSTCPTTISVPNRITMGQPIQITATATAPQGIASTPVITDLIVDIYNRTSNTPIAHVAVSNTTSSRTMTVSTQAAWPTIGETYRVFVECKVQIGGISYSASTEPNYKGTGIQGILEMIQ